MAGDFLLGALAAYGALSAVWTLLGWLLPDGRGCALVCWGQPDDGIRSRVKWLRGVGLLRCPLLVVVEAAEKTDEDTEICSREELPARLEWERKRYHGTGNGDPPGRHQRRGISEL